MAENEYTKAWDARDRARENRIEALRAASRVVAGLLSQKDIAAGASSSIITETTTVIAEQFAKWLETGER